MILRLNIFDIQLSQYQFIEGLYVTHLVTLIILQRPQMNCILE